MCVSPIHVKIKRIDNLHGFARNSYTVPCGKCWQCRLSKQNMYFVRSFYQWQMTRHFGGYASFVTLTYNNDNLPKTPIYGIPTFFKPDCQKYIKRVRKNLALVVSRNQFIPINEAQKTVAHQLSYICVSEYGEHTARPHYHVLFFLKCPIVDYFQFSHILKDAWKLGFTRLGNNFGLINSESGIKYVTKYIGKTFCQTSNYNETLAFLNKGFYYCKSCDSRIKLNPEKVKEDIEYYIKNKPFILLSKNFGMFAFSDECPEYIRLNCHSFEDNKVCLGKDNYPLPSYFRRKVCYDVRNMIVENLSYKVQYALNKVGYDVKRSSFANIINNHRDKLLNTLSPDILNEKSISRLNKKFGLDFNPNSFIDYVSKSTQHISSSFVDYSYCFQFYRYLVPLLANDEVKTHYLTPCEDVCEFMDLVGSNTNDEINSGNYENYLPYLEDVAFTVAWYDFNYPDYLRVCKYFDYLNKYYGNVTQKQKDFEDKLAYNRKLALGKAL